MSELSSFFGDSAAKLGSVFYPEDFVVATLLSSETALEAATALEGVGAGVKKQDVRAVSSREMLDFFEEFRSQAGATGKAMRGLSRFIDTEAKYADADIDKAKKGHGFVVVRCETRDQALRVADLLGPFHPSAIEWYRATGVESLL